MADGFDLGPAPKAVAQEGIDLGPAPGSKAADTSTPTERKPLENAPGDDDVTGTLKNLGTSAIKGLSHIPGLYGDLRDLPKYAVRRAKSVLQGRPLEEVWAESEARDKKIRELDHPVNRQLPIPQAPSGHDISAPILKRTGEYEPTTTLGKYGATGVEGALAMLRPGGILKNAESALVGGATATGAQGVHDYTGSTDAAMLAGLAVPVGLSKVTGSIAERLPRGAKEQQALADKRLAENYDDPQAAARALRASPKDELALPAEVTGGTKEALATDAFTNLDPKFRAKTQNEVLNPRNEQRQQLLASTAPADAEAANISKGFQEHLDQLNAARDAQTPPGAPPLNASGQALREAAHGEEGRGTVFKESLDRLKKSIDPEGKMNVWVQDVVDHAKQKLGEGETRPMKDQSPIATRMYEKVLKLGDGTVSKFSDLVDLDQALTATMKDTRGSDTVAHNAANELKGQVKGAINNAIENQHKWEANQVKAGALAPEETLATRLERQRDDWLAARKMAEGTSSETGTGPTVAKAAGDVPAVPDAQPGGVRPGDAGGAGSISGTQPLEPNLTPDTANRLKLFNQGYGVYKDTFGKGPVGKAGETDFGGQPKQMAAEVANNAFTSGSKGYETAQMWLHAGGEEGLAAMKDIATNRLLSEVKPGEALDQKTLDGWRTKHRDALRAIDEVEPGFSQKFNDAATAQQAVQDFTKTAAAKFLGAEHPDDIVNMIGRRMNADNSAEQMTSLMDQARNVPNPEPVVAGIQRAAAEHLSRKFSLQAERPGEGGNVPVLGDGLKKFIDQRRNTLETIFDKDAMSSMDKLAESFSKSILMKTLQNTQGSATAARQSALLRGQIMAAVQHDVQSGTLNMGSIVGLGLFTEFVRDPSLRTVAMLMGKGGIDKVLEHVSSRRTAADVNVNRLLGEGFANKEIAAAMLERAVDAQGRPNPEAFRKITQILATAQAGRQESERSREGRASGGGVFDHMAAAKHLIGMVDKARKRDALQTKPLLQAHDTTVAHALAIANRSI